MNKRKPLFGLKLTLLLFMINGWSIKAQQNVDSLQYYNNLKQYEKAVKYGEQNFTNFKQEQSSSDINQSALTLKSIGLD